MYQWGNGFAPLNGGYAQLHAKTADCCFDHSHHVMIYGREKI